jgi:hypothetical protein
VDDEFQSMSPVEQENHRMKQQKRAHQLFASVDRFLEASGIPQPSPLANSSPFHRTRKQSLNDQTQASVAGTIGSHDGNMPNPDTAIKS